MLPHLKVLEAEQLDQVHAASLAILDSAGLVVAHETTLDLIEKAGGRIDRNAQRAWLPPELVMRQLAKAERRIVLGGRTPERDIVLPGAAANLPVTRPITGPDRWLDHRTEEARPARTQDLLDWTQVIEQLPHLDFTGLILTHDLPPYSRDVAGTALMLQHTTKHVHTDPHSAEAARLVMDDEWLASVKRIMQGMAVDAERLAVDVFREVGPRGQFLATDHTARHCRSLYLPGSLRDRQSRPAWEASGRPSLRKAARERLESLLLAPPPEPLPPEVVAELDRIVRHAAQTLDRVES